MFYRLKILHRFRVVIWSRVGRFVVLCLMSKYIRIQVVNPSESSGHSLACHTSFPRYTIREVDVVVGVAFACCTRICAYLFLHTSFNWFLCPYVVFEIRTYAFKRKYFYFITLESLFPENFIKYNYRKFVYQSFNTAATHIHTYIYIAAILQCQATWYLRSTWIYEN